MASRLLIVLLAAMLFYSCASKKGKDEDKKTEEPASDKGDAGGGGGGEAEAKKDDIKGGEKESDLDVSSNFVTFTVSLTNNKYTSKAISRDEAMALAEKLSRADDSKELVAAMSARRLAGRSISEVVDVAKKLIALEMKKNPKAQVPEFARMEIALAAIHERKFSLAEYYLLDLLNSKRPRIKAAALTAQGMIAAFDERLPEAVTSWNNALKVVDDYQPALLNLGFTALKFGDAATAKRALGGLQGDWYVASGLLVAERLGGDGGKAQGLCNRVLQDRPSHKPTYYNCALNELQNQGNPAKAQELIKRMVKVQGMPEWDEKAFALEQEIAKVGQKGKTEPKPKENSKPKAGGH